MKRRLVLMFSAIFASLLMCGLLAGTAAANGAQLCFANETPCSFDYGPGSEISVSLAAGTNLKKYVGENLIEECSTFSATGETSNTGAEATPVGIVLKSLAISNCSGYPCTPTVHERGNLSVENILGTMNGKVSWGGFKITEVCGSPYPGTCVLSSEVSKGIFFRGGSEALLKFEAATVPKTTGTSAACGDKKWTATLAITQPKPLYVSGSTSKSFTGAGTLCKSMEFGGVPCFFSKTFRYGAGTPVSATLKTGTSSVLNAGFPEIECEGSSLNGELEDPGSSTEPVVGAWTSWNFSGCNCSVSVPKAGNFSIDWTSGTSGTMVLTGFQVKANCGGKECVYGGAVNEGITLSGGNPAAFKAEAASVPKESGAAECEGPAKWTAEYEVTAPKGLYVAKE